MDATKFNFDTLAQRLRELAFLNKGLTITLTDERADPPKQHEFHYSGGIAEFIKHLNQRQDRAARQADLLRRRARAAERRHADAWKWRCSTTTPTRKRVFSFANNINTVDGGSHLSGFRSALTRTINAAAQQAGLFKDVKGESDRRRRARRSDGRGQREAAAAAVRRADQGQAEQRYSGLRRPVRQRKAGRVLRQESGGDEEDRLEGDRCGARPGSGPQGSRSDAAQRRAGFRRPARQAGRLPGEGSGALRVVPGRGRVGRRHREERAATGAIRRFCR